MAEHPLKNLMLTAYAHYNQAIKDSAFSCASYWDGYIAALQDAYNEAAQAELNAVAG